MSLVSTLLARRAGHGLHGLNGAEAEQKIATFTTERKLELFRAELVKAPAFHAAMEQARAREDEGRRAIVQDRFDEGKAGSIVWEQTGPLMARLAADFASSNKAEYGLRDQPAISAEVSASDVLDATHWRVTLLADALRRDYERHEPEGLVALRKQIREATLATWEPRKKLKDEKERYNAIRGSEAEAQLMTALAALASAEAEVGRLQREAWDLWAVKS